MIEEKVREYLEDKLDIPVRMEEEPGLPEEYVLIEKTGSGEENHIASATLAIQSYSGSLYGAASLNERVKEAMEKILKWTISVSASLTATTTIRTQQGRNIGIRLYTIWFISDEGG